VSRCAKDDFPCFTRLPYNDAQDALAARLRQLHFCAGREADDADHIYVAVDPARDPSYFGAGVLWLEVHAVAGNAGGDIWCWGCVFGSARTPGATAVWRVRDGAGPGPVPSPGPSSSPAPTPRPAPTPEPERSHDGVWSATITVSSTSIRPGGSVVFTCHPRDRNGRDLAVPPDTINVSAGFGPGFPQHLHESPQDGLSKRASVDASAPSGQFVGDCAWYGSPGVFTNNLVVTVTK